MRRTWRGCVCFCAWVSSKKCGWDKIAPGRFTVPWCMELLNWRDAQRELKGLIKARYRQWGVLRLHGIKVFSVKGRKDYLDQLPAEEERRMMRRLYSQLDHAIAQWKETLQEVERLSGEFWEVRQFQRIPGVGPMAAHVFSAII